MLDHFQRRHHVEARALGDEVLDQPGAIGQPRAGRLGVGARDRDRFRRRIEPDDLGAHSRQRFGDETAAAADVEQRQAGERRRGALQVAVEMTGDDVAQPRHAGRVQAVQRRHRPGRIPPLVAERGEAPNLLVDHACDRGHA